MTIIIAPFTVGPNCDCKAPSFGHGKEEHIKKNHPPITYWGIYFDDKHVSYTSSEEMAEKTRIWMEKWLKNKL